MWNLLGSGLAAGGNAFAAQPQVGAGMTLDPRMERRMAHENMRKRRMMMRQQPPAGSGQPLGVNAFATPQQPGILAQGMRGMMRGR